MLIGLYRVSEALPDTLSTADNIICRALHARNNIVFELGRRNRCHGSGWRLRRCFRQYRDGLRFVHVSGCSHDGLHRRRAEPSAPLMPLSARTPRAMFSSVVPPDSVFAVPRAQIVISDELSPSLREFTQFGTEAVTKLSEAFQEGGLTGAMGALGGILSDAPESPAGFRSGSRVSG